MNQAPPRAPALALFGLLFASGFCGISYEVLYARLFGNFLGDHFAVRAAVLLTFMVGIGAGTLYAHRLWRHLWLVEAAIGACGVALATLAPALEAFVYRSPLVQGGGTAVGIAVGTLLLIVPACLIGCTLPLFAGYLAAVRPGRAFALAYMAYNLGAAATALLIEYWLLRQLGLKGAFYAVGGLNGVVALALLLGFRRVSLAQPDRETAGPLPGRSALAALVAAGLASAVFQLLLVRLVECLYGPFHETFALVLATVLFGLAVGSAAVRRWNLDFGTVLVANLAGLIWLAAGFGLAARAHAQFYDGAAGLGWAGPALLKLGILGLVALVPAATFGATIPALLNSEGHVARESGKLLFVASLANAAGFVLMAFGLHSRLDYGQILLAVAALSAAALVLQPPRPLAGPLSARRLAPAAAMLALVVVAHRWVWDESMLYLGYLRFRSPDGLAQARSGLQRAERFKGHQDTFAITWIGGRPYFYINGYISFPLRSPNEAIVGSLSALFSPRTDRALVLGLGSGVSAGAVGLLFDRTDAVEINPAVVSNLHRMSAYNFDVVGKRLVRPIVDDGIHFLKAGDERYSLILNTVTSPLYFSSSKLYTREFLRDVRERLAPDGVYVTWVDSRVGERGVDIITRTVANSFRHVGLCAITSSYYLLVASHAPLAVRRPGLAAGNDVLASYLRERGIPPEHLAYSLMTTRARDLIARRRVPLNTVDRPVLEFEMASLRRRGIRDFRRRLVRKLAVADIASALEPAMRYDPAAQRAFLEASVGESILVDRWKELGDAKGSRARR